MTYKTIKSIVFFGAMSALSNLGFACGNGAVSAPCPTSQNTAQANTLRAVQQGANPMQAVIAIQQQALRNSQITQPKQLTLTPPEDTFTTASLGSNRNIDHSVVAVVNKPSSDPKKVSLLFPGERIGYSINAKIYESLLQDKKITPIGTQFVAMPQQQASQIKSLVIGGASLSNLRITIAGDKVDLVADN